MDVSLRQQVGAGDFGIGMMTQTLNDEALRLKMSRWVERLKTVRIFRPLRLEPCDMDRHGNGRIGVVVSDGLVTITAKPFEFNVATMEFETLYANIETLLVESFRAHVRTMTAPELVLENTLGVDVVRDETDGEERYVW